MTLERNVKARVREALANIDAWVLMPVPRGFGAATLDYICGIDGRLFAVETKVPKKHLTLRQRINAMDIAAHGSAVFVIRDSDDILTMLKVLDDPHHGAGIYDTLGSKEIYGEHWCE